ncbi:MAG: 50S ribosomal protein L33 [Mycoplasmoidaceae bacterium]
MAKKIILICDECLSRNYKPNVSSNKDERFEINKYCKHCNKQTLHKESR